jgi:hypothetical protein
MIQLRGTVDTLFSRRSGSQPHPFFRNLEASWAQIGGREAAWVRRMTGRMVVRAGVLHQKFCAATLVVDVYDAHGARVLLLPVWFYLA